MKGAHRRTGRVIKIAMNDINSAITNLGLANSEDCTEKTLHLIDEALECLEMSKRFLGAIDMTEYDAGYVSSDII